MHVFVFVCGCFRVFAIVYMILPVDTSIQQTVLSVASSNGFFFSVVRQQTVRFWRRLNKRGKSFFDLLNYLVI